MKQSLAKLKSNQDMSDIQVCRPNLLRHVKILEQLQQKYLWVNVILETC